MLDVNEWPNEDPYFRGALTRYLNSIGFRHDDIYNHYKRIGINVMFFKNLIDQIEKRGIRGL